MKNKIIIAAVMAGMVFSAACGKRHQEQKAAASGAAMEKNGDGRIFLSAESLRNVDIRTEAVARRQDRSTIKAMGKVIIPLDRQAIISYAFPARIAEGHVAPGDRVRKGQALVTLESEEVGNTLSEFYKTSADLELSRLNLEREQRLFENGVAPKKDLLAAENDFQVAQASREAAEKKLHVLGFNEQQVQQISHSHQVSPRITLYSPIAGKIVSSRVVRGMMTEAATEILVIFDLSMLWIDAEVYEKDIAHIHVGQKVDIHVPAYPDEHFSGSISYISDTIQEETRTITVRTQVANPQGMLKPGMFADLHIFYNGSREILAVPANAVLEEGDEKIVFVQEGDHYVKRGIRTGSLAEGSYEVLSGLRPGERVVTQGLMHLKTLLSDSLRQSAHIH
jgi:cobalt-zinc-cadmium efflux system membrane fusion protein